MFSRPGKTAHIAAALNSQYDLTSLTPGEIHSTRNCADGWITCRVEMAVTQRLMSLMVHSHVPEMLFWNRIRAGCGADAFVTKVTLEGSDENCCEDRGRFDDADGRHLVPSGHQYAAW